MKGNKNLILTNKLDRQDLIFEAVGSLLDPNALKQNI